MPERRKLKSPSPQMTSTPKLRRRELGRESPEDLSRRLGFRESPSPKKELSYDTLDLPDYDDGTTRPMFKKRLNNVTAKPGEGAELECVVSGTPTPKVLWLKNNRPLKESDNCEVVVEEDRNILKFASVQDNDVGMYTARAMNVNGSAMCTCELTQTDGRGPPALAPAEAPMDMDFTTPTYFFQMSSCEVNEGRLARFDCRVCAYPKPEITWMRDGKVIDPKEKVKLLNFNNEIYSLLIQDVTLEDSGRYTCWARNKFGEAMTEAYLNVIALQDQEPDGDIAPQFLTKFYDQQTTEGLAAEFKAFIAGRPEPEVTWLLNDVELHDKPGQRIRNRDGVACVEMKQPKMSQSGEYTCILKNRVGEATCSARLMVIEDKLQGRMLPRFFKKFDHTKAREGEEVKFTAVVVGEPKPSVTWMFDHKTIDTANRRFTQKQDGDVYTLILKVARFEDAGMITCKAANSEGEVYCSANLHIRESKFLAEAPEQAGVKGVDDVDSKFGYVPTFTKRLQDVKVSEGARAKFDCKVMGIPEPEISWMKDGRVIAPGGRFRMKREGDVCELNIENVTPSDAGVYTCIISNSQGKSSSTAELKLDVPKRDRYSPEKKVEEKPSKRERERYSPEPYVKPEPYIKPEPYAPVAARPKKPKQTFTDRLEAEKDKPRKAYESPLTASKYDDISMTTPKSLYESPVRKSYDSPTRSYARDEYKRRSYESPIRSYSFDEPLGKYSSPVRSYALEEPKRSYVSPIRSYAREEPIKRYESPYSREEPVKTYDRPSRPYVPRRKYSLPVNLYTPVEKTPERYHEAPTKPKMPFDRPTILNKREDSVRLSWQPAPTRDLPIEAQRISYVVEARELPRSDWTRVASDVPSTSHMVKHLRPDKQYEFRVRAQNPFGVSEPTLSAPLERRVDESRKVPDLPEMRAPPRLPTYKPVITDLGEETLRLAWRPVETYQAKRAPPVSYRLEAKELPGKDWMPLSTRLRDTTHYLSELPKDRDFMIRVRAENDFGVSEPTEPLWLPRARTFPGVPVERPEIIDVEATRAKLSWARVDIPTYGPDDVPLTYMLEAQEPKRDWRTIARDLDDTEYIVEGLRPDSDYKFRVRAKLPTGIISEPSPAASLYTTLARARAPIDRLEVLEYEPDARSVQLSWQRVDIPPYSYDEEPLMYMIEYQEPPMPDWHPLVTGIPTTRYRVMHLDPQRDYNFRVRALTPYGVSPPSPALPVTLKQATVGRPLPEAITLSEVEPTSARLTWRRPMYDLSKPMSYNIEMLEPPYHDWRPVATGITDTTYRVTGLKPTKDYQFRVIPRADTVYLTPTPSVSLTSAPVKPRLPTHEPKLTLLSPESAQLSWQPAELPVYHRSKIPIYYKIEMQELPSTNWVPVARRLPDTHYSVTGLRPNINYKFRVLAETDYGMSEPSLPASLYRKPAPKFALKEPSIADMSQNIVALSWEPATLPSTAGVVSYMVEIQTPPGIGAWTTLYPNHPSPSLRLADLRPDLDYLVRVRAKCGDYISEPTMPLYIPRRAAPPRMSAEEPYAVEINPDYVKLHWRSAQLPSHIMDYAPISYRLEAQELPGGNWITVARGIPHTDFKVTGLNPSKDYQFRVRAENDYGVSDPTRSVTIQRRSVAPNMPHEEPMMYDIYPNSVRLSWRPASMPSHVQTASPITYTIYVQEPPNKAWRPLVKRIPGTSYHVTGLIPDRDYYFRVQAENEHGPSRPSSSVYLPRYSDIQRPISIPEVSDFDDDLTFVKLHWKPRAGSPFDKAPQKYQIESWEPVRREWRPVARGIRDTSYHLRDLPRVPDHLFRVRMETDQAVLSEPSLPVSVSRFYSLPKMPVHRPQLYEVDDDTVRLSWQTSYIPEAASRKLIRYSIEQREIPDGRWSKIASDIIDQSYKVRGLRPKMDYEFRVRVFMDGIGSEPSYPVALFRKPVIPKVKFETPEVTEVDEETIGLRWKRVDVPAFTFEEEPLSFMIERQSLPHHDWQPVATYITGDSVQICDLKPYQDYKFRVRGVLPSGYTEPSPAVPVYRRPSDIPFSYHSPYQILLSDGKTPATVRRSVPITHPEVWETEPYSARLRWHRAYIPQYYSTRPHRYRIEMQEADSTASDWKPVASGVATTEYTVNDISPRKDYNFRIRAELENGDISEPTPPIQYHRTKLPMKREPYAMAEYKPIQIDATSINRPYIDHLTKYVPPRLPIDKPDMVVLSPENVELSWKPAREPESIRGVSNLTYAIEVRNPPSFDWHELVSGLKTRNYMLDSLHPHIDYTFRIRAMNEYGSSEPSLPVSLYRPRTIDDYDDDEEWEREFEARFGVQDDEVPIEQVPPKLPMDTPEIVTQTPDSIWFQWLPARIPAYATKTPITYVVEMKEPPSTNWRRDVTGLVDTQHVREGLSPSQDYHIRVRAESEFGISEPTLPIIIQRSKSSRPGSRLSSVEREEMSLNTKVIDNLTSGVPPRMSSSRPLSTNSRPDGLTLSWNACRVPTYVKKSNVVYVIEKREPPGHIWTVFAKDIKDTKYNITGLNPDQDYMFRVRARNEYGTSDPSLPLTVYRERDDYVPPKIRSRSGSRDSISAMLSVHKRRSMSMDYESVKSDEDYKLDKTPLQPEYITTTYDTQYGAEGQKGKICLQVKAYPLPEVHWYFGEEKLEYGDAYNTFITPKGEITLEIKNVGPDSVGEYKCYAENASGAAVKVVTFLLAEPPTVLEPLQDKLLNAYQNVTLKCRVDVPLEPTVKWMKDWLHLADSSRLKMERIGPDTYILEITNALGSDSGVYACQIENKAGKVTLTCRLTVEDDVPAISEVILRSADIRDYYHVLEEIGRGEHGVVRKVVEMSTGKRYAANFMYMRNRAQKNFFLSEFEALRMVNQADGFLRLHDAFETERSLIFVTEILTGPELLQQMVADGTWTEAKVASVVKQLLTIMQELQSYGILHLDIKPSNIRLCGPENGDLKLINFALARFLNPEEEVTHNYGSVGFASPEQIDDDVLTLKTDMWSIGVLTYVLLSGVLPFQGEDDAATLRATMEGKWSFGEEFENISKEARDFITKLLVKNKKERMSLDASLAHPWLSTESSTKINMDRIKNYYNVDKLKREANKLYTTAYLQSLRKILHGTAALYQPAIDVDTGEIIFPDADDYGDYLDEDSWYEWQLQYLDDPDSQHFPLRDRKFTVRESKHAAADAAVAKKEEDKEPECDSLMFVNKIENTAFELGENPTFICSVTSKKDTPVVTWYRDETLLTDQYRAESSFDTETGIAILTIVNAKDYDAGVYKCVARNKDGRVSCQARLALGERPGLPGRPVVTQISGDEAFLTWTGPVSDGNSYILGYRVDYKKSGDETWTKGPCVTEEYAVVSGLEPNTGYIFRVTCHNKYGTSPYSWASLEATTLDADAPKIAIGIDLQPLLQFTTFTKQQLILPAESRRPSLSEREEPKIAQANPEDNFVLGDVLSKGSYGEYKLCSNKATNKQYVMKIVPYQEDNHAKITREFDLLRRVRQNHIISVCDSYISGNCFYLVFERLSGMNILQYLCLRKFYKEDLVANVVTQILDALQYLHSLDIVHCNLQPSSIVMATLRRPHVKLRDFSFAQKIMTSQQRLDMVGYPDFVAPEVIKSDPAGFCPDLWGLGVLTFILLSGVSPFSGDSLMDTLSRIVFDRYCLSDLYDNVTKDSIKFIAKLLKRLPRNRATINQCLNSRWLQQSESMIKAKNKAWFSTHRLRDFSKLYLQRRADPDYMNLAGVSVTDLPRPTTGPPIQPILSDKVVNRNVVDIRVTESKSPSPDIQVKHYAEKIEKLSKEVLKTEGVYPDVDEETIKQDHIGQPKIEELVCKEIKSDELQAQPNKELRTESGNLEENAAKHEEMDSNVEEPDLKDTAKVFQTQEEEGTKTVETTEEVICKEIKSDELEGLANEELLTESVGKLQENAAKHGEMDANVGEPELKDTAKAFQNKEEEGTQTGETLPYGNTYVETNEQKDSSTDQQYEGKEIEISNYSNTDAEQEEVLQQIEGREQMPSFETDIQQQEKEVQEIEKVATSENKICAEELSKNIEVKPEEQGVCDSGSMQEVKENNSVTVTSTDVKPEEEITETCDQAEADFQDKANTDTNSLLKSEHDEPTEGSTKKDEAIVEHEVSKEEARETESCHPDNDKQEDKKQIESERDDSKTVDSAVTVPNQKENMSKLKDDLSKADEKPHIQEESPVEKYDDVIPSKSGKITDDKAILELSQQTVENVLKEAYEQVKGEIEYLKSVSKPNDSELGRKGTSMYSVPNDYASESAEEKVTNNSFKNEISVIDSEDKQDDIEQEQIDEIIKPQAITQTENQPQVHESNSLDSVGSEENQANEETIMSVTKQDDEVSLLPSESKDTDSDLDIEKQEAEAKDMSSTDDDETVWDEKGSSDSDQVDDIKKFYIDSADAKDKDSIKAQDSSIEECAENLETNQEESVDEKSSIIDTNIQNIEKLAEETVDQIKAEALKEVVAVLQKHESEVTDMKNLESVSVVEETINSEQNVLTESSNKEIDPEKEDELIEKHVCEDISESHKVQTVKEVEKEENIEEAESNVIKTKGENQVHSESVPITKEKDTILDISDKISRANEAAQDPDLPETSEKLVDASETVCESNQDISESISNEKEPPNSRENDSDIEENPTVSNEESNEVLDNSDISDPSDRKGSETSCEDSGKEVTSTEGSKNNPDEIKNETNAEEEEPDEEEVARLMAERAILEDAQLFC